MTYLAPPISFSKQQGVVQQAFDIRPDEFDLDYSHPLARGLSAAYLGHRPGGLMMLDSSRNQYDGILTNMETSDWTTGIGRQGLLFGGTDEYVALSGFTYASVDYSLSAWVNMVDASLGHQPIIGVDANGYGKGCFSIGTYDLEVRENISAQEVLETDTDSIANGIWYHVAHTYDAAATTGLLYINGSVVATDTSYADGISAVADYIGSGVRSGNNYFNGRLFDLMIHTRTLNAGEIAELASKNNVYLSGLIKRPPVMVRGHSFQDLERPNTFEINTDHPLADSLELALLGNNPGSTTAEDSSTNENDGTLSGAMTAANWQRDDDLGRMVLDFNGDTADDWVDFTEVELGTEYSMSIWAKSNDFDDWRGLFGNNAGTTNTFTYNATHFWHYYGAARSENAAVTSEAGRWDHFGLTRNGADITYYKNGVQVGVDTADEAAEDCSINQIGRFLTTNEHDGLLADGMLWTRELSAAEVKQLADAKDPFLGGLIHAKQKRVEGRRTYTVRPEKFHIDEGHRLAQGLVFAGLGRQTGDYPYEDSSPKRNHGTLDSTMTPADDWSTTIGRPCLSFTNGTSDNVEDFTQDPFTGLTQWAIAGWVKWDDVTHNRSPFFGHYNANTNPIFWLNGETGQLGVGGAGDFTWAIWYISTDNVIQAGRWYHIAARYDGVDASSDNKLFVNGVAVAVTGTFNAGIALEGGGGDNFRIASGQAYDSQRLSGQVADAMIWNRALSPDEIKSLADRDDPMLDNLIVPNAPKLRAPRSKRIARVPAGATSQRPDKFEVDFQHPLAQGLCSAWLGGDYGSNHLLDCSRYGGHGELTGMDKDTDWSKEFGNRDALDFDGSDDKVVCSGAKIPSGAFTISAWVNQTNRSAHRPVMSWAAATTPGVYTGWAAGSTPLIYLGANNYRFFNQDGVFDGEWTHFVFTCPGSAQGDITTAECYQDGVSLTQNAVNSGAAQSARTTTILGIAGSNEFLGQLADVMVWDRVLTKQEIDQIRDPANVMLSGLLRQPARKSSRLIVPHYHAAGTERERPDNFVVDNSHPLAKDLVYAGLGSHPGGSMWFDSFGEGHADLINISWTSGPNRRALNWADTETERLSFPGWDSRNAFTLAIWVYANNLGGGYPHTWSSLRTGDYSAAGSFNECYFNADTIWADGGTNATGPAGRTSAGKWQHHVYTLKYPGNKTIYIDGVAGTPVAAPGPLLAETFHIGSWDNWIQTLNGKLADIIIWDRVITPREITLLGNQADVMYNGLLQPVHRRRFFPGVDLDPVEPKANITILSPSKVTTRPENFTLDYSHPLARGLVFAGLGNAAGSNRYHDSSVSANHGTLTNMAPPTWAQAIGRVGVSCDGSNDYVVSSANVGISGTTPRTLACWCRDNNRSTLVSYDGIVGWGDAARPGTIFEMASGDSGGTVIQVSVGGGSQVFSADIPELPAKPNHLALILPIGSSNVTDCLFYENATSASVTGNTPVPINTTDLPLVIGRSVNGTYVGPFDIFDMMIWDRALSIAELVQLADPGNFLLSGLILPTGSQHTPSRNTRQRHWVGQDPDFSKSHNWAYGPHQEGGAGAPTATEDVV